MAATGPKPEQNAPQDVYLRPSKNKIGSVVTGVSWETPMLTIPGIVSGAAYAVGDALGTLHSITLPVPRPSGFLTKVVIMDRDKEALAMDLELFSAPITDTADNAAFALADADHPVHLGTIAFTATDFSSYANEASATKLMTFPLSLPQGVLWLRWVARGVQNLTATTDYGYRLSFLLDP